MIIFISGPMTGLPEYNRPAFFEAERLLMAEGFTVINPARHPDGLKHEQYLHICRAEIDVADAIYQLRGWRESKGAQEEYTYAKEKGKGIIDQYAVEAIDQMIYEGTGRRSQTGIQEVK